MPYPVQDARFARALRRLFSLQGHLGAQAIDDIFPVVDLLSREADRYADREETLFAAHGLAVGAAGQFPGFALWNNSADQLVVIDRIFVALVGTTVVLGRDGTGDPGAGTAGVVARRDTRLSGAFPWLVARQQSNVSVGGAGILRLLLQSGLPSYALPYEYVMAPDVHIVLESNTPASTMHAMVLGHWRKITPGDALG